MRQVAIVGGGVAGLTLGILLRRSGVPVQVWDAAGYPRHRVCGEFISGRGAELLSGLLNDPGLGPVRARTVRFFTEFGSTGAMPLPEWAFCISRWELDRRLAELFRQNGGELFVKQRWTASLETEGVVRASGRRLSSANSGWTGVKAHVPGMHFDSDLEMHFSKAGYVGISRLQGGANVCALLRPHIDLSNSRAGPGAFFAQFLHGLTSGKIAEATCDTASFCTVTRISFDAVDSPRECCIGDAFRMIPPFTGNGMSLAVESAFLAAPPLVAYARREKDWNYVLEMVKQQCTERFRIRFASAALLRRMADRPWMRAATLSSLRTFPSLLGLFFRCTR